MLEYLLDLCFSKDGSKKTRIDLKQQGADHLTFGGGAIFPHKPFFFHSANSSGFFFYCTFRIDMHFFFHFVPSRISF